MPTPETQNTYFDGKETVERLSKEWAHLKPYNPLDELYTIPPHAQTGILAIRLMSNRQNEMPQQEIETLDTAIEEAAKEGKYEIWVSNKPTDRAISELLSQGFQFQTHSTDGMPYGYTFRW